VQGVQVLPESSPATFGIARFLAMLYHNGMDALDINEFMFIFLAK
jgi:hypothetical protein